MHANSANMLSLRRGFCTFNSASLKMDHSTVNSINLFIFITTCTDVCWPKHHPGGIFLREMGPKLDMGFVQIFRHD